MTDPDQVPRSPQDSAAPDGEPVDTAQPQPVTAPDLPQRVPGAGVRYAALRLLLLVTVGGVLSLVGMRGWALLFVAVLASGVLSFFLFARQREAAARNLEAAAAARAARHHPAPGEDN